MKITAIKDLIRKDVPIYYRRVFSGTLIIDLLNKTVKSQINFTIETKSTGLNEVIINNMAPPVDYPLIPLVKEVKKFILILDETGELPS
jgi:hypothetical protein